MSNTEAINAHRAAILAQIAAVTRDDSDLTAEADEVVKTAGSAIVNALADAVIGIGGSPQLFAHLEAVALHIHGDLVNAAPAKEGYEPSDKDGDFEDDEDDFDGSQQLVDVRADDEDEG